MNLNIDRATSIQARVKRLSSSGPAKPSHAVSVTPTTGVDKEQVLKEVVRLLKPRATDDEAMALFEVFITRLSKAIRPENYGERLKAVWMKDEAIYVQTTIAYPVIIAPGKDNPLGSVTGPYMTDGGWGTPAFPGIECPACNSDSFKFVYLGDEHAVNVCEACGHQERFICKDPH